MTNEKERKNKSTVNDKFILLTQSITQQMTSKIFLKNRFAKNNNIL